MAQQVLINDSTLTSIADAIRNKTNTENTYRPGQMAQAILSIKGGGASDGDFVAKMLTRTFTNEDVNTILAEAVGKPYIDYTNGEWYQLYVNAIERECFSYNTIITDIEIPTGYENILPYAFRDCTNLKTVKFNNGLVWIQSQAFYNCSSLEEVVLPSTCTRLYTAVFGNCPNLKRVILNEGLEQIGVSAFNGSAITSLTIPKSVKIIESSAFANIEALTTIVFRGTPSSIEGGNPFSSCKNLKDIYVPWSRGTFPSLDSSWSSKNVHYDYVG